MNSKIDKPQTVRGGSDARTEVDLHRLEAARERDVRVRAALRRLVARQTATQDDWQRRVAEGLHDGVAQILVACSIKIAHLQATRDPARSSQITADIERLLRRASEDVRAMSAELVSSTLYRVGLEEAVAELCEQMSQRHGLRFDFVSEGPRAQASIRVAATLFGAVRELLSNVVRHAGVSAASVVYGVADGELRIIVEDQGKGFEVSAAGEAGDAVLAANGGLGLLWVQEVVAALGGRVDVEAAPGEGTRVALAVPLGREGDPGDVDLPGRP